MKFYNSKLVLLVSLFFLTLYNELNALKTGTHTTNKTNAKTSIFSYDYVTVMKRRRHMRERGMHFKEKHIDTPTESAKPTTDIEAENKKVLPNTSTEHDKSKQNGNVLFSGWIKYFKYENNSGEGTKPNSFFKNNEYTKQHKVSHQSTQEKQDKEVIPDQTYWWTTLFKQNLVISASKKEIKQHMYDNLNIDSIQPVVEGPGYAGGIIDFGSFSEGACFKLQTTSNYIWVFCTESNDDKAKLMEAIKNVKISLQRKKGELVTNNQAKKSESLGSILGGSPEGLQAAINPQTKIEIPTDDKTTGPVDGYWVVLQNWSQCTKKCDGGVTTLHQLCIPPKRGGKACEGQAIMTKPCNTQPCPGIDDPQANQNNHTPTTEHQKDLVLKPIVKVMPISSAPLRYHKCVIKEGDFFLTKIDEDKSNNNLDSSKQPAQTPVRVVLNTRTISLYENAEDFTSQFVTYNLKTSEFAVSKRDTSCFVISEEKKASELCPLEMDRKSVQANEWEKDFNMFKNTCETKPDTIEGELQDKMKEKMKEAKIQMLVEREELIKEKLHQKEEQQGANILKKTSQVAQQALLKEETLEKMIQREEEDKERRDYLALQQQVEEEKKKDLCIMQTIKEKELENRYKLKDKATLKEVEDIKDQAKKEVILKRAKLKEKITKLREEEKRREAKLQSELMNMRMTMAQEMNNIYKIGDQNKCVNALKDDQSRLNYCTDNFSDVLKFAQCKENEDFCNLCCETEFGEMHFEKRNGCITEVCNKKDQQNGRWVWTNKFT